MRAGARPIGGCRRLWGHGVVSVVAVVCVLGAVHAGAASATPSRFVYEVCDSALPGGNPPTYDFGANPGQPLTPFANCATPGGAMGIAQTGQTSGSFSHMDIAIPSTPGGWVENETISGISVGMSPGNHLSHIKAEGWPGFNSGESQRTFHLNDGPGFLGSGGGFAIVMSCDGNVGPCSGGILAAHYIAATETDPNPPSPPALGGSIFSGEPCGAIMMSRSRRPTRAAASASWKCW